MMKNNVNALLLSMGLLVGGSNAHVTETILSIEPITANTHVDTKVVDALEPASVLSTFVTQICANLAAIITTGMRNSIEKGSSTDGSFSYEKFSQAQAELFPAIQEEVINYLEPLDVDQTQKEQILLFVNFLMAKLSLFLQENTSFSLDLMQATTLQAALAIIDAFDQFMLALPEQFAADFAAGKIQKPVEPKYLNNADVDYSTEASRSRVALLLSKFIDLLEDLMCDAIEDCTDEDGMFDGQLYTQRLGLVMQRISTESQSWLNKIGQEGIAYDDMFHIVTFLTKAHQQGAMKFRLENPRFDIQMAEATTEIEALELIAKQFAAMNATKEQYINENFPDTEQVEVVVITEEDQENDEISAVMTA